MRISSWWRDTARLYLRYLIAIAASTPAAVAYAYLSTHKLEGWGSTIVLLAAGLIFAAIGWRFSERLFLYDQKPSFAEAYSDVVYGFGFRLTAVMAASFVVLCGEPTRLSPPQTNTVGGESQGFYASTETMRAQAQAVLSER
jgi:hypothetical protein